MIKRASEPTWEQLQNLDDIEVPVMGTALVAIGMEECEACEIVAKQIGVYVSKYEGTTARLYKFATHGRSPEDLQLLGEELRFFPTVLGFVGGSMAFRMQGVLANATPTDVTRLERGFDRFAARCA